MSLNELTIALGLFNGIQIRALKILDQGQREHIFIVNLTDEYWHFFKPSYLGSLITPLTSNDLVMRALFAHQNRLKHTVLCNRICKLL